jgi:hypothetical protein
MLLKKNRASNPNNKKLDAKLQKGLAGNQNRTGQGRAGQGRKWKKAEWSRGNSYIATY